MFSKKFWIKEGIEDEHTGALRWDWDKKIRSESGTCACVGSTDGEDIIEGEDEIAEISESS